MGRDLHNLWVSFSSIHSYVCYLYRTLDLVQVALCDSQLKARKYERAQWSAVAVYNIEFLLI